MKSETEILKRINELNEHIENDQSDMSEDEYDLTLVNIKILEWVIK